MATDETLSRSFMLLCFGAAGWLFVAAQQAPRETPTLPRPPIAAFTRPAQISSTSANSAELVVKLSERLVYLYRASKLKATYPIAIGQPGWETPSGSFKVLQMSRRPVWRQPITGEIFAAGRDNPLGDRWIGFWSDGRHLIGFHGTNTEQMVGRAVSHGCLRMRNQDIREMYEHVSAGTPVIVRN